VSVPVAEEPQAASVVTRPATTASHAMGVLCIVDSPD
jgi:hypothetical protein